MKLQNNMITKQTKLINNNKEFREKLSIIDFNFEELKKRLKSKVLVAQKSLLTLLTNCKNMNERLIEIDRNMHKMEQCSCPTCIKIASILE